MQKRRIIFDTYDTAADGLWTLASCVLGDAEPESVLLNIPGRLDGPLDASEALTGDVQYGPRPLDVTLESSEGTRLEREARINDMVNRLHGRRVPVWLPDDPAHYVIGRLSVKKEYNDLVHAAVKVTATCEPWRYATEETFEPVLLCGKNLFDNQNLVSVVKNWGKAEPIDTGVRCLVNSASVSTWTYDLLKLAPIETLVGKTLTLSYTATASGANTPRVCIGYCSADGSVREQKAISLSYSDALSMKVESSYLANCDYVGIWLYSNHTGTASEGDYIDFTNLQVEVGDTPTAYEAYTAGGSSPQEIVLANDRRKVYPTAIVQGEVTVEYSGRSVSLGEGKHQLTTPLKQGEYAVTVTGTGSVTFTYRRAVL